MPIIAWEIKIWRALRQSKTPTFYERDHRLRMMAMSKIDVLWGLVPDRTDMTQQTTNLLSECINGAFLTNFFNLQACPEASAVLKFLVAKTATAAKTVTAAKWFKTTLSFAFLPKSPTGTTQGQPGASAPGPSANISKSPTGTTHGESEHAIADRGVVPVGTVKMLWLLIAAIAPLIAFQTCAESKSLVVSSSSRLRSRSKRLI